jgi:predicted small lipoprotein YifL
MRSDRALSRACLAGVMIGLVALAGCGKKGPLEAPPGAVAEPAPVTTGPYVTGAPTPVDEAETPAPPQHDPFVLDPLL